MEFGIALFVIIMLGTCIVLFLKRRRNMSEQDKHTIYDHIFEIIQTDISDYAADDVFKASSFIGLGKVYYKYIIQQVDGANIELINEVIQRLNGNFKCNNQSDYYEALVKIIGIRILPSQSLAEVKQLYDEIFVNLLCSVNVKYDAEMARLETMASQIMQRVSSLENRNPIRSFSQDMTAEEHELYQLSKDGEINRSRKEMLKFAKEYIDSIIAQFGNIDDATSVESSIRTLAIKNSCEEHEDIRKMALTWYKDCLVIFEDDIVREYALFFKIKQAVIVEKGFDLYRNHPVEEAKRAVEEYLGLLPSIDEMHREKENAPADYNATLKKLISDYDIVADIATVIDGSVCLRKRSTILKKVIKLYKDGEYELFNNIVPVQIEGMFADYLRDTTAFLRFEKQDIYGSAVLRDKIDHINGTEFELYPDATEYFKFYFNNMIRNRVAHGRYYSNAILPDEDEAFASELLLDLNYLANIFTQKSELDRMHEFVSKYLTLFRKFSSKDEAIYRSLYNDLTGNKLVASHGSISRFRPIQVVYWLLNPYYENIYSQVDSTEKLLELRGILMSKAFWSSVLNDLIETKNRGYGLHKIDGEFEAIIKGMFNAGVDADTKKVLAQINATMKDIRKNMCAM